MNPNASHLKHLSPDLRHRLEQGLQRFKENWSETLMAETLGQLSADHPLRQPSMFEMTCFDLAHRWKLGQRIMLEQYLKSYPELGSVNTVSVDLIRLEYKVRKAHGDHVEMTQYERRFPTQYEAFRQRTLKDDDGKAHAPITRAAPLSPVVAAFGAPTPVPHSGKTHPVKPLPARKAETKPRKRWPWIVAAPLLLLLAAFLGWMGYKGGFSDPKKFFAELFGTPATTSTAQASDPVQSLTVKLDVGAGEAVQEPIYLDLGLGFPLWLVSGGSPPPVPFGAVPQQTTTAGKLPANSITTFTFLAAGEPGQDVLTTTPQLLSGVKVGDIRRVGFASLAQQDWELAGYEIQVNGQTLHAAKGLKIRPKQLQAEAMKKLGALNQKAAPANQELSDLRDLVQSGLASDAEKARLKQLQQQTFAVPATEEKTRLERQLRGQSPWYAETVPSASAPAATAANTRNPFDMLTPRAHAAGEAPTPSPHSVRVTVVTDASHDQSGTSNYVYFLAGGHKYPISGPDLPLTSKNGPQVFELDLLAGPLDPSDLRDWGLGMLAPPMPRGKGPDRWHPRRLQVDVDGKTVYDSEQKATDRQTLAAIRLVPPSQLDLDGSVVKNSSNSRLLYVWQAGKATGFDSQTGAIDPWPAGTVTKNGTKLDPADSGPDAAANVTSDPPDPGTPLDPVAPIDPNKLLDPNNSLVDNTPSDSKDPDPLLDPNKDPDPGTDLTPPDPPVDPDPILAPGENPIVADPDQDPSAPVVPPVIQIIIAGPFGPNISPDPFPDPGPLPFPDPGPLPFPEPGPVLPPDPKPAGKLVQIDEVKFVVLSRSRPGFCNLLVTWTISPNDESGVANYDVILQGLEDDLSGPGLAPRNGQSSTSLPLGPVGTGLGTLSVEVPDGFILDWRFVAPVITPIFNDATITSIGKFGPARSTAPLQGSFINATFVDPQQIGGPKVGLNTVTGFTTHAAFAVFDPRGAEVVSLAPLTSEIRVSLTVNDLQAGTVPAKIRFYTGFSGGKADGNTMEYRVQAFANKVPATPSGATTTLATSDSDVAVPNQVQSTDGFFTLDGSQHSMHAVTVTLPPKVIAAIKKSSTNRWTIELTISMRKFNGDATEPPVVFDATVLNK